jgi:hypothetical protein
MPSTEEKKPSVWVKHDGWEEIEGIDCLVWIAPRPGYCDRGNYWAQVEAKPTGNARRLDLDASDMWPRYYMNLDRAKLEIEEWMKKRRQWIES